MRKILTFSSTFLLTFVLFSCSNESNLVSSTSEVKQNTDIQTESNDLSNPVNSNQTGPEIAYKDQLQERFNKNAIIHYDENERTYVYYASSDSHISELISLKKHKGFAPENWLELKYEMIDAGRSIQSMFGSGYTVKIVDPEDNNKNLLVVKDGDETYSVK